jgi:tetratricopeptide (TPR) repeat protein
VSTASKRRCGFWGSGGIGKTTTSAWLCRQSAVRKKFSMIVWVTVSQTPNILACQRQLFAQLTGQELPVELTADEKTREIEDAFSGKDCLLILDDVWEWAKDISSLASIDESTKSRILISSRVRSTLDESGCEIVDFGLPSDADAVQILISAAGMAKEATPAEDEVLQVVRLCKRLPLTLGIAGKMVSSLGLEHSWSEVITLLQEELTGDGEARSAEDTVIATSLRAIKGPRAESARKLLRAFALVPEDVKVPLEALRCIYQASDVDSHGISLLQLRRLTKLLIDRCILLGPIDQPSIHDIVGDFASSMSTEDEIRGSHRRLVDILRDGRLSKHGWNLGQSDDRLTVYVVKHCEHHIKHGWAEGADWASDEDAIRWLDDCNDSEQVSQDVVPLAAARFLGTERVAELAKRAESSGDWWKAGLRWSAAATVMRTDGGHADSMDLLKACAAALLQLQPTTPQLQLAKERIEIPCLRTIITAWVPEDSVVYAPRLVALNDSAAARENVERSAAIFLTTVFFPSFFNAVRKGLGTPEEKLFGRNAESWAMIWLKAVKNADPGSPQHTRYLCFCYAFSIGMSFLDLMTDAVEDFSYDEIYGEKGCLLNEASKAYDFDRMHTVCVEEQGWDGNIRGNCTFPLFIRWGDLDNARATTDRSLGFLKQLQSTPTPDASTLLNCLEEWPALLYLLGRHHDAAELLQQSSADWASAEETITSVAERLPIIGDPSQGAFWSTEDYIWNCRSLFVLVAEPEQCPSAEEFMAELPDVEALAAKGISVGPDGTKTMHGGHFVATTSLVFPALALEKLGQHDAAMAFALKQLEKDQTVGGSPTVWHDSLAHRCRGRLLVAAGQPEQAREAFEAAVACAASRGYWMLEALAVNDLNIHCIHGRATGGGGGDTRAAAAASRRLEPLLHRLVGPSAALEALLEQQPRAATATLHAPSSAGAASTASRQPPAPTVAASSSSSKDGSSATRQELEALSLMKLHRRACDEGVDVLTTLKGAMESDNPKQAIISLLLESHR